jgi:hypothetical protein
MEKLTCVKKCPALGGFRHWQVPALAGFTVFIYPFLDNRSGTLGRQSKGRTTHENENQKAEWLIRSIFFKYKKTVFFLNKKRIILPPTLLSSTITRWNLAQISSTIWDSAFWEIRPFAVNPRQLYVSSLNLLMKHQ